MSKMIKLIGSIFIVIFLSSCDKEEVPVLKPVITSFLPIKATLSDPIRIVGKNFTGATAVDFGGVAALSFTIQSDSVIMAVVGNAVSGNVTVHNANNKAALTGFVFYQSQDYTLYGTANFIEQQWPQGNLIASQQLSDTAFFDVLELNKYDTARNAYVNTLAYLNYASQEGYVRLVGLAPDLKSSISRKEGFMKFIKSSPYPFFVIYAKKTSNGFEIPMQGLYQGVGTYIIGTGVLSNGKLTLTYKTEYRGSIKEAVVSQQ